MTAFLRGVRDYDDAFFTASRTGRDQAIDIAARASSVKDAALWNRINLLYLDPAGTLNLSSMQQDVAYYQTSGALNTPVNVNSGLDLTYIQYALQHLAPTRRGEQPTPGSGATSRRRGIPGRRAQDSVAYDERKAAMTATVRDHVSADEVGSRVRDLLPGVASRTAEGEANRRLPEQSAKAFLDAGLTRILAPRRFGGYELGLDVWFEAVAAIAAVDAAHAWCASLLIHHPHYLAQFPIEAQERVWIDGPDVAIATSLNPTTQVVADDGGYRLTGEGAFTSGIGHSSWAMVGGFLPVAGPPKPALFLLPAASYTVRDDWQTIGMRGTGSNAVVTAGAFVPQSHVLPIDDLLEGTGPGGQVHDNPIYRAPLICYAPLTFVVPMLGAGKGALEWFRGWATPRMARKNATTSNVTTQIRMGRAAADLDAAELLLRRGLALAQGPVRPTLELRARSMRDYARASELIVSAVNELLALSGTAGFALQNDIQKIWRDVNFASRHVTLNADNNYAYWSTTQLGVPRNPVETTMF